MQRIIRSLLAGSLLALAVGASGFAHSNEDPAIDWRFDTRWRAEQAEIDGLRDATALTASTRFGFATRAWRGLSLLLEAEHIEAFGAEQYNDLSNGQTQFAPIPDPQDTELNQAYLAYQVGDNTVQLGRMPIKLDDERFIGDVRFRQNQQTFDALALTNESLAGQRFQYMYMNRARRSIGDDNPVGELDMHSHVAHYQLQRLNSDTFSAYAYLIEMRTGPTRQASNATVGFRYKGTVTHNQFAFPYLLEYARQQDYADANSDYSEHYVHLWAGVRFPNAWLAGVGYELLGGDGSDAFQTPLATAAAFNGFADVFATRTPSAGLVDQYLNVQLPLGGLQLQVSYHEFDAHEGSARYGSEVDLQAVYSFANHWQVGLRFADYNADDFGGDTKRLWAWVSFTL